MSRQPADERPEALESFMADLRDLRRRAGQPSFRRLAARSGVVSHATLHLTVTGYRLQPWETVREFVRACDGDEQAWQARWERAHAALAAGAGVGGPALEVGASDDEPALIAEGDESGLGSVGGTAPVRSAEPVRVEQPDAARPGGAQAGGPHPAGEQSGAGQSGAGPDPAANRWSSAARLLTAVAAGMLAVAVVTGFLIFGPDDSAPAEPPPVQARIATEGEAMYAGDASKFITDVTIPDGTVVRPGEQFVKVWKIKNTGTVPWRNRFLLRTDPSEGPGVCRTPTRIPLNDTAPQQDVQITVTVEAPGERGYCKVNWKMVDEYNRVMLPGKRPVYFEVVVRPK